MKEIYQALVTRLKTVPNVKDVRRYNNQQNNEKAESKVLNLNPGNATVLIEFADITVNQRPGSRTTDTTMTVRLYISNKSLNQDDDYSILDAVYKVKQSLHSYSGNGLFGCMRLRSELTDTNHGNVYTHQLEYSTFFTEVIEYPTPLPSAPITTLEIDADLDIDNRDLNLGDGDLDTHAAGDPIIILPEDPAWNC